MYTNKLVPEKKNTKHLGYEDDVHGNTVSLFQSLASKLFRSNKPLNRIAHCLRGKTEENICFSVYIVYIFTRVSALF